MSLVGAFIVPHPPMIVKEIGRGGEKQIQKTIDSYQEIAKKIKELKPETIIISSPHTKLYYDCFAILKGEEGIGNFRRFGAKEVEFREVFDTELIEEIEKEAKKTKIKAQRLEEEIELDHGTMVPLYFIEKEIKDFKLVVIGLSGYSYPEHYQMGQIIQKAIRNTNRRVAYVASGDLSHKLQDYGPYGFTEEGPIYDQKIVEIMQKKDFLSLMTMDQNIIRKASECGHRSFLMMAGALDGIEVEKTFLSHEDITGVGYGISYYIPIGESENRHFLDIYLNQEKERIHNIRKREDEYITLARNSIEKYVKERERIKVPENTTKELINNRAGVFVTIYKWNRLRGCIGSIIPTNSNIAEEIISKAISSCTYDPRFEPVTEDELDYLEIHVDILRELEEINSKEDLDVKRYGIVVSTKEKRGVLLPNIDSVETIEDQIKIAMEKGNIQEEEDYKIERFEVIRHE